MGRRVSRAARIPRGDELPPLPAALAQVGEAPPDPPPGPDRDRAALLADARIRGWEQQMTTVIEDYLDRVGGVIGARARSPRTRKGTRWWRATHNDLNGPPVGGAAVEVKARPIDAAYILTDTLVAEIADAVGPVALSVVSESVADTATKLGHPDVGLAAFDEDAVAQAVDSAVNAMLGVAQRHAEEIRRTILDADATAQDLDELLRRVEAAHRRGGNWVLLTGRTLTVALAADAALAAARALGVTHVQWLSRRDTRVRATHRTADGQVRAIGDMFRVGQHRLRFPADPSGLPETWPEVANCFVPGTSVSAPDVEGSFRAPYVGEVITIRTASGNSLTGTPNHPVLTERGWVPLGELHEADYVVSARFGEQVGAGVYPDVQGGPAVVEQVHDALARVAPAQRVPGLSVNFHGDRPAGEVDVVTVDRPLRVGLHAAFEQQIGEHDLPGRSECTHGRGGTGTAGTLCVRGDSTASSDMGSLDEGVASGVVELFPTGVHSVGASPWLDLGAEQAGADGGPADPEEFGQRLLALASLVTPDDLSIVDVHPASGVRDHAARSKLHASASERLVQARGLTAEMGGHLSERLSRLVQLDRVSKIERRAFRGHVYTLQAASGMFTANTIITKNCRCSLLFAAPDPARAKLAGLAHADPASTGQRATQVMDAAAAADPGAGSVLTPEGAGLPTLAPLVTLPEPVAAYRELDTPLEVVPGQQVRWPDVVTAALAPPTVLTAATMVIALPAGTRVAVAGGQVVFPAGTVLNVLEATDQGVVATPA